MCAQRITEDIIDPKTRAGKATSKKNKKGSSSAS